MITLCLCISLAINLVFAANKLRPVVKEYKEEKDSMEELMKLDHEINVSLGLESEEDDD